MALPELQWQPDRALTQQLLPARQSTQVLIIFSQVEYSMYIVRQSNRILIYIQPGRVLYVLREYSNTNYIQPSRVLNALSKVEYSNTHYIQSGSVLNVLSQAEYSNARYI